LGCIGLSEYEENFTKHNVQGKELLSMQKQDMIVSEDVLCISLYLSLFMQDLGMEKVGHQAKLRQALRVITKTTNSKEVTQSMTENDVTTSNNNTTPLTPSTLTVSFLPSPTATTHPSTL